MIVTVKLHGCDDTTTFDVGQLDEWDLVLLEKLESLSQDASTYGCEPTMTVKVKDETISS